MNRRHHMEDRLRPGPDGMILFEDALEYVEELEDHGEAVTELRDELESAKRRIQEAEAEADESEEEADGLRRELDRLQPPNETELARAVWWLIEQEFPPERELTREQMDVVDAMEALGHRVFCGAAA